MDNIFDWMSDSLDTFFKSKGRQIKFMEPALLGLTGCFIFAIFDRYAGSKILDAFTEEHVAALGQPFFVVGNFLLALHLLLITPDGKSFGGKWIIGTFVKLSSEVISLGVGIWLWIAVREFLRVPSIEIAATVLGVTLIMLTIACYFDLGTKLCHGDFYHFFEGYRGRRLAMRLAGLVLISAAFVDLNQFVDEQTISRPKAQTKLEHKQASQLPISPGRAKG